MQIMSGPANLPSPRPAGGGVRVVEPVTELLHGMPSRGTTERVLQGEFLERGRDAQPAPADPERLFQQRQEDHPAFYPRQDNDHYLQRRAIAAYHAHTAAANERRGGATLDYFI